ncbi:MAG: TIGR01777 family protein [Myxococcales bacterium]|nr:TIGR01777 family protein [Myxococcales bacterium]
MRIFITGATGFIGGHLARRLLNEGHELVAWVRDPARARLDPAVERVAAGGGAAAMKAAIDGCDAVINLAGEPVIGRWSEARKRALIASRVDLTEALVAAIAGAKAPPRVLLSASAVGYYGDRGDEEIDEAAAPAPAGDFLADLCKRWEAAAAAAEDAGVRVVLLRIGIVLGREGGALQAMIGPARLGLGGPMGSGAQWIPWIHVDDLVAMIVAALGDARYRGAVNGVGPAPARSRDFAATLGAVLRRPAFLRVPAFALRMGLGEAASALLGGQRALPRRAQAAGFRFRFATLEAALRDLVG